MKFLALLITAFAPWLAGLAQAQELPSRVGRIAYVDGQVSLFNDPEEGWQRASLNYPITSENSVWTDGRSRAELRVSGIAMRLDERTQFDVARLDDDQLDGFIAQGALNLRVRYFENNHRLDLATPHARFRLYGVGRYAIVVDESRDETSFTVFAGSAALRGSGGDVQIRAGSTLRVMGGARPEFWFEQARTSDFDRWAQSRDERWKDDRARRYVSTYMTGYEDLDAHGEWRDEADFGVLWYPARVERDWAPYRYGRWDYVRPWGWTWIDDAPWGYAPFHYGRWVYVRDRWAWSPGTRVDRPTWAPALVGWVGGGAGVSVNVSTGPSVGWYPLSPWDRYEPWFRASPTYLNRINVVVRDRPNRPEREQWRTWTRDRGATIVQREQFVSSRPVHQARVQVAPEAIQRLQPMTSAQALPPETEIRQRRAQIRAEPVAAPPAPQQQAQGQQREVREGREGRERREGREGREGRGNEDRAARGAVPQFQRSQPPPAPAPADAQAAKGQPGPAPAAANAPNPAARGAAVPPGQGGVPPGIGAATPGQGALPPGQGGTPPGQTRSQQQEQLIRGREAMERQQREQRQQQERATREEQQSQQQQQQRSQQEQQQRERTAREGQQSQERAAREQQHSQQQQQQQKAQADQQQRERAAREAQQSQQQQQQRAQQEQAQQQQKAQAEQQQRERATREAQQSQQQQQQRTQQEQQQRERAAREQQQQQERAARENAPRAREAQPPAAPAAPAAQPPPPAAQPAEAAEQGKGKGRGRDKEKDDEEEKEKEKGKGRGRDR